MIIVYEKRTNNLVGVAAQVFDNGRWREPTIEKLYPGVDLQKLGIHSPRTRSGTRWIRTRGNSSSISMAVPIGAERKPSLPRLHLSTNAKDTDGDSFPELIADGKNKAVIMAHVRDELGRIVSGDFTVNFKTTAGTLSARQVMVKAGKAEVELISSLETVTATVSVSGKGLKAAAPLTFEFMPPGSK